MHVGNLTLTVAASLSLLVGASFQGAAKDVPFPVKLFQQASAEHFIGSQACAECHGDQVTQFHQSGHATYMFDPDLPLDRRGCEGCHGPGKLHLDEENPQVIAYLKMTSADVAAACLRCHGDTLQKPHWDRTAHAQADVSCVSCHQIHPSAQGPGAGDKGVVKKQIFANIKPSSKLLKADEATLCGECHQAEVSQFRLNSHHPLPEGRILCSDCHEPHPVKISSNAAGPVSNKAGGKQSSSAKHAGFPKESCVACHAEVAGPFVFEHDPVAGWSGDGCAECHRAHGSNNPQLLKAFSRGLCAQCHTDKLATHFPGRTCWTSGCHVAVHGSNSDQRLLSR